MIRGLELEIKKIKKIVRFIAFTSFGKQGMLVKDMSEICQNGDKKVRRAGLSGKKEERQCYWKIRGKKQRQ